MTVPVLITARLPRVGGAPEDDTLNDFAFLLADAGTPDVDDAFDAVVSFYNTVQVIPDTDYAVAGWLAETVSRAANACRLDAYDLTGALGGGPHGSPFATRLWTLGANAFGNPALPSEVAAVLSFHSDLDGIPERDPGPPQTRPAARRRGRVYIGPLDRQAADSAANTIPVTLRSGLVDTLNAAATLLAGAASASWSVWSRAGAAFYGPMVGGWVDDAFDTQRRRGEAATIRTTWTA